MTISKKPSVWWYGILILLLVILSYSNHFHNAFHFDDAHSVENNPYIRDVKNIPLFFKDGSTSSSLPQNQSYRPVVSTTLAIDYWLGGGYNLFYFHLSSFMFFLAMGVLMYLVFKKICSIALNNHQGIYIALFAVAWYMLHPAIAETINYVIARSDLLSTFGLMLSFVLYIYVPFAKRSLLYLLPVALGALAKPTTVMFAPILFFYILLFEEELSLAEIFQKSNRHKLSQSIKKTLPALIFCGLMYLLIDRMTPKTWEPGGQSVFKYLITQPFVMLHYCYTLFIPDALSADTDWRTLDSIVDIRFFTGVLFILVMITIAWLTSKSNRWRPVSFGILWFFLALIPTSSIIPLAEVMNDHRMFFPFIGLALAVSYGLALLLIKFVSKTSQLEKPKTWMYVLPVVMVLPIYAFGTYKRSQVWKTEESLWYDVTVKSPENGRGLMNYGLSKMKAGDYKTAEVYFNQALQISPYYPVLHTNMAILKAANGDNRIAETHFLNSISYGPNIPDTHYFYARFLADQNRYAEAIPQLEKSVELSPSYLQARILLLQVYQKTEAWTKLKNLAESTEIYMPGDAVLIQYRKAAQEQKTVLGMAEDLAKEKPTTGNLLNLSLSYYQAAQYRKCITICEMVIRLNPNLAEAYNNMGSAYNRLGQYEQAIAALNKALVLKPEFQLAKNNLQLAQSNKLSVQSEPKTAEDYLNLSLNNYNKGLYQACIDAAGKALKLKPDYDLAYNNICAAYNKLEKWNEAILAAKQGLKINPANTLLKNNLAASYIGKGK